MNLKMIEKDDGKRILQNKENYCSNCTVQYNNRITKSDKFKWFDRQKCDEKDIGIVEAAVVVFEGLLSMNEKQISPTESLSMCFSCVDNISELYRNYREFMGRSAAGSYFRELFQNCMLWPPKTTQVEKPTISSKQNSPTKNQSELNSKDSKKTSNRLLRGTVEPEPSCETKVKNENDDNENYMTTPSDNEYYSENESLTSTENLKKNHIEEKFTDGKPQFINGEWLLPKILKIFLTKYVPGNPETLDIGKGRQLRGKIIRVNRETELTVPNKIGSIQRFREKQQTRVRKTCSVCNQVFTNIKVYFDHRRKHRENNEKPKREYPCKYCGKILTDRYKLLSHEVAIHKNERPFECKTCKRRFPLKERLNQHIKYFHENTIEFRREKQKRKEANRIAKGLPARSRQSKYVRWEVSHPNELDRVFCELCKKSFSTPQAKENHHRVVHLEEKPLLCKFCGKGFITESLRTYHEQAHLGIRKNNFNCTHCSKSYGTSRNLQEHMASQHMMGNPCICEQCGKTYATPKRLRFHRKWVHDSKDEPQKCEICEKVLKNRQILYAHRKLHTEERPFLCTECGARFKTQKTLLKHTITQHGKNAAATCQLCQRGFTKMSEYEEHMEKGYHIKPKWLRPTPTRKRNYNAPSYIKARIERKLQRQLKRLEKDPNAPAEIQTALKKEAEDKLKFVKVKKREKKPLHSVKKRRPAKNKNITDIDNDNDENYDEDAQWEEEESNSNEKRVVDENLNGEGSCSEGVAGSVLHMESSSESLRTEDIVEEQHLRGQQHPQMHVFDGAVTTTTNEIVLGPHHHFITPAEQYIQIADTNPAHPTHYYILHTLPHPHQ